MEDIIVRCKNAKESLRSYKKTKTISDTIDILTDIIKYEENKNNKGYHYNAFGQPC